MDELQRGIEEENSRLRKDEEKELRDYKKAEQERQSQAQSSRRINDKLQSACNTASKTKGRGSKKEKPLVIAKVLNRPIRSNNEIVLHRDPEPPKGSL